MTPYMKITDFIKETGLSKTYVMKVIKSVHGTGYKMSDKPNSPYIVNTEKFLEAIDSGKATRYVE